MKFFEKNRNVLIFLFLSVFVIYGVSLWGNFVFDDRSVVDFYEVIKNPTNLKQIFSLPYWSAEAGLYRPITILSYSFNYLLLGTSPIGFHFINLILYELTCFFIFKLLKKLFDNRAYALLTAFIFLILPIHSEVIANIIGRAEIMALLFSVLFLNELIKDKINYYLLGLFLFLAIGSKETAVAVLPIALFVMYFKERRFSNYAEIFKKYFYPLLSVISATILYFCLRLVVLGQSHFLGVETSIIENPLLFASFPNRLATAFSILAMYVGKVFVPFNLCSDYSFNQIPILDNFWHFNSLFGLVIFLFATFSIFYFIKKRPIISMGSAVFIFSFLPVSNLFFPIGTVAGERLMFYPSLGLAMILAYIFIKIFKYIKVTKVGGDWFKKLSLVASICIIIFYIYIGISRSVDWLTEKNLFISARECAPNSVLSLSNMGAVYYFEGKYKEAEAEFLKSMAINSGYSKGLNNLGLVYWKMGDHQKAKEFYHKALQTKFPYPGAYENLALLYLSEGDIADAKRWLLVFFPGNQAMVDAYIQIYKK